MPKHLKSTNASEGEPTEEKERHKAFALSHFLIRRNNEEILELAQYLKKIIQDSPTLYKRVSYFWSTNESLERVLFILAEDIPKGHNPLWGHDENEIFEEECSQKIAHKKDRSHKDTHDVIEARHLGKDLKKRQVDVAKKPKCVEWLGLVNDHNGFAAIKIFLPVTQERWVTWANRVMAFLFGDLPSYEVPEDFVRVLKPAYKGPLQMHCQNPRCVRVSHIQAFFNKRNMKPEGTETLVTHPQSPESRDWKKNQVLDTKANELLDSLDRHPLEKPRDDSEYSDEAQEDSLNDPSLNEEDALEPPMMKSRRPSDELWSAGF